MVATANNNETNNDDGVKKGERIPLLVIVTCGDCFITILLGVGIHLKHSIVLTFHIQQLYKRMKYMIESYEQRVLW